MSGIILALMLLIDFITVAEVVRAVSDTGNPFD